MNKEVQCPCCSGIPFDKCCEPLLKGKKIAETAKQLMRSRYTAFSKKDDNYLLESWAAKTRPKHLDSDEAPVKWIHLDIHETELGGAQDTTGVVCFTATFIVSAHLCRLQEESRFIKEKDKWFYLDGKPESSNEKIARNSKCPCGSGKKFKRCCL